MILFLLSLLYVSLLYGAGMREAACLQIYLFK
ncbi:hypothetical protein Q427_32840 [Halomonas sp. BC04]|nr:hypothetical protein Q427_32840 [Halomonas sp. BC04]